MLRWIEEPRFNDVTANGLCGEFVAMRATQQVTTLEPLSDEKHFSSPEKSGGEEPAQEVSGEHYEQPSVALNPSGVMSPPPAAPFVPDPALAVADAIVEGDELENSLPGQGQAVAAQLEAAAQPVTEP